MVRLRNTSTGVVVRVDDATATRLGSDWQPVDAPPAPVTADADAEPAPPKGNASRASWAAYADAVGVEYGEDATRNEIKAAVAATS